MGVDWDDARKYLRRLGDHAGEWAGIPCPVEGQPLTVHPRYPFAKVFKSPVEDAEGARMVNEWYDRRRGHHVLIWREANGELCWGRISNQKADKEIKTLGASIAWDIDAEITAMEKLRKVVEPHKFRQYFTTGSFLETSKRSGVTYLFRRLRPTVAMRGDLVSNSVRILAALCLHPIGFYNDSWAGAMVPTDDVIAHLLLMRGDEHGFWKQANQHPAWRPEAGI